ncbi:MAG TPA: hypothetical protein VEC08_02540 [Nitrososphaerales archaeon]|nr:hypothetical protein [Nitrososphaerales archaeon]
MRRIQAIGLALAVILIGVTIVVFAVPSIMNGPVCGGGVYNAKVGSMLGYDFGQPAYNLTFTKNGGQETGLYDSAMSSSISWIKANTPSGAVFMNWWDYGKEIVGCTGRGSVISNPSMRFVAMGFASGRQPLRDSEEALTDVGTALFTTNATLAHSIASKYGTSYLLITVEEGGLKAPYILKYLGLNTSDYFVSNSTGTTNPPGGFSPQSWTTLGQQTVVYRLLDGQSVPGFVQVYSDSSVKIFSVG